ncbi:MAG: hypothetical protein AAF206_27785 [Bacteroidota bacterium]
MRILFMLSICLLYHSGLLGQNEVARWNTSYRMVDLTEVFQAENQYAATVEKDPAIPQYYFRHDKLRFYATFTGQRRSILPSTMQSMKHVYQQIGGDVSLFDDLVIREYLFRINGQNVWIPIQKQLEYYLASEIGLDEEVMLYCLMLVEHSERELRTSLLVSEFQAVQPRAGRR